MDPHIRSPRSSGKGKLELAASSGIDGLSLKPNSSANLVSRRAPRSSATCANAVLTLNLTAVAKSIVPNSPDSKLRTPMYSWGPVRGVDSFTTLDSSAAAPVIAFNDDPGGYRPDSARLKGSMPGTPA